MIIALLVVCALLIIVSALWLDAAKRWFAADNELKYLKWKERMQEKEETP